MPHSPASAAARMTSLGNSPDLSMNAARCATTSRANCSTCFLKASCSAVSSRIIVIVRSFLLSAALLPACHILGHEDTKPRRKPFKQSSPCVLRDFVTSWLHFSAFGPLWSLILRTSQISVGPSEPFKNRPEFLSRGRKVLGQYAHV